MVASIVRVWTLSWKPADHRIDPSSNTDDHTHLAVFGQHRLRRRVMGRVEHQNGLTGEYDLRATARSVLRKPSTQTANCKHIPSEATRSDLSRGCREMRALQCLVCSSPMRLRHLCTKAHQLTNFALPPLLPRPPRPRPPRRFWLWRQLEPSWRTSLQSELAAQQPRGSWYPQAAVLRRRHPAARKFQHYWSKALRPRGCA
mmetsp:Transcript_78238/g.205956  ORF Transcript_78238/g.205956 Transcript_78238/m.205956 type:complete len:201 (-) Transcript_78238:69-671(-)